VNWIKGVARVGVVGIAVLLSLLLTVDCATAHAVLPAVGTGRTAGAGAQRAEPERDLCPSRRHDSHLLVLPQALTIPAPAPRSGSASDDADGADDDTVPDAITAPRAARHVVPLCRSGELPVALRVFRS
jgi:hypothetical protein